VRRVPGGAQALSITPADGDWRSTTLVPVHVEPGRAEVELPPVVVVRPRDAAAGIGELGYTLRAPEPGADPRARRLVVAVVRPGGPAAAAGLQVGDEILRVDGHDVTGPRAYLHTPLTLVPEGQGVTLGLARGAEVRVTAGPQP
jgi:S1-C subfamily serine protease